MAKGKQRAWNNLDGLYRDVEDARRHSEHGSSEEGAAAWERWLELIDIAMYALSERDDDDVEDDGGDEAPPDEDPDGPDEGRQQLALPRTGRVEPAVQRGTSRAASSSPTPSVVGAGEGMSFATPPVGVAARKDKRRGT